MVPTFAVLYLLRAGDFYSATARTSAGPLPDNARQLVESDVRSWFAAGGTAGNRVVLANGWTFNIDDLWLSQVVNQRATNDLLFKFSVLACDTHSTCTVQEFQAHAPIAAQEVQATDSSWFVRPVTTDTSGTQLGDMSPAFPGQFGAQAPAIGVHAEADTLLTQYAQTPPLTLTRVAHTFERMLYLSAITITTVGYGDVVPVTFIARVLVASEAVLGIVIAGLFLNTLAHSVGPRPPRPREGHNPGAGP